MDKKIVLITGGTDGIGKASATGIALTGATVIIVGRDKLKATKAVSDIKKATTNADIEAIVADLSSIAEVDRLVDTITSRYGVLDVLINNVGFLSAKRETTVDGFEKVFFLNHLLPLYLSNKLAQLLERSKGSRIINVAGGVYGMGKININDLQTQTNPFKPLKVISNAKLAMVMSTFELARKLKDTHTSVFISDPGVATSGMGQQNKAWPLWFRSLMPFMATSAEKAAESTIYAATASELSGKTGLYINAKCAAITPKKVALDKNTSSQVWLESNRLLHIRR